MKEIKVKKFSLEDVTTRVLWINNPNIHNNMFFQLPATMEKTKDWCINNQKNNSRIDFSFLDNNGQYLAMGGFTGISKEHGNAEFYVMVNPGLHGNGIGKEVSRWMYNYAFSIIGLYKIYLYTNDDNIQAYSIYEKSGFYLEGVLRQHKCKNGKYQNRRIYGLLKSEWENLDWRGVVKDEI